MDTRVNFKNNIYIILLMGLFTFLFLGTEYLYVDLLSCIVSQDATVIAQNYALGASSIGFLLYPLLNRLIKSRFKNSPLLLTGLVSIIGIVLLGTEYTFIIGLVLFLFLGIIGSCVYYQSMCMLETDQYLARIVGISYFLGIMLQFISNNLIHTELIQSMLLGISLFILIILLIKNSSFNIQMIKEDKQEKKSNTVGIILIILVALMTCMFSTLDNAVTLVHAGGDMDIGQWPRILLALSGLVSGFIFDLQNRRYMGITMYCIMVLSTICIAILKFAGPFMLGLMIFYLSAGFFAVFFVTAFMEIARYMKISELWSGMGRAVNNLTAAIIASPVLALLSSDSNLSAIILILVLFVAVSIVSVIYTVWKNDFIKQQTIEVIDEKEKLRRFSELYSFTDRETEVFEQLVNTEDSIQVIAENIYVSKRTLERYVSAIYEKTGVKLNWFKSQGQNVDSPC